MESDDDNASSSDDDALYATMESNNKTLSFASDYLRSMMQSNPDRL